MYINSSCLVEECPINICTGSRIPHLVEFECGIVLPHRSPPLLTNAYSLGARLFVTATRLPCQQIRQIDDNKLDAIPSHLFAGMGAITHL